MLSVIDENGLIKTVFGKDIYIPVIAGSNSGSTVISGSTSLARETVYSSTVSVSMDPSTVYVVEERTDGLILNLNSGDSSTYSEYYLLLEIGDTVPSITWPSSVKFAKDFSANANSVIAVRIVNGVVLWEYLYQESPKLYVFDYTASDPYCQDVSGGWTRNYYTNYGNTDAKFDTSSHTLVLQSSKASDAGCASLCPINSFDIQSLYDAGYRYAKFLVYTANSNVKLIYLSIGSAKSNALATALGGTYVSGSTISSSATTGTLVIPLVTAISKGITKGYLTYSGSVSTGATSGDKMLQCWFDKEA